MKCNNVAVYGTLKRGYHANSKMDTRGCKCLGSGVTGNTFDMTDCGFPMLKKNNNGGSRVIVEVYSNPDFRELDSYEGVPSLYTREVIKVHLDSGATVQAWIYVGAAPHGTPVEPDDRRLLSWPAREDLLCAHG